MKTILLLFIFIFSINCYTLHFITHTHDDLGWIKSMDFYYENTSAQTQGRGCVRCIYDSVFIALKASPDRRFSICEMGYFKRWWLEQNQTTQSEFRKLVDNKQVEFVGAGFSSNDEAAAHYEDIIVNFELGLQFLHSTFGVIPRVGWQLDPFGHSSTQARLNSQFGYDLLVFSRIFDNDKSRRKQNKEMDFIWQPKRPVYKYSTQDNILAHVLNDLYVPPYGMCFDESTDYCHDPEISSEDQARQVANTLTSQHFDSWHKEYQGDHLFIPVGNDFGFYNASRNFENLDKLIKHWNSNPEENITARYSTPSEFLNAFIQNIEKPLTVKEGDFFPHWEKGMWTGQAGRQLQVYRKFYSILLYNQCPLELPTNFTEYFNALQQLGEVVGNSQHHDAITGTSTTEASIAYVVSINEVKQQIEELTSKLLHSIFNYESSSSEQKTMQCDLESCEKDCIINAPQENNMILHVFNPANRGQYLVKIKANSPKIAIKNSHNALPLKSEVICDEDEKHCIHYFFDHFEALCTKTYFLVKDETKSPLPQKNYDLKGENYKFSGQGQDIFIDKNGDFLFKVCEQSKEQNSKFCQEFPLKIYYRSYRDSSRSGAYLFEPTGESVLFGGEIKSISIFNGKLISKIQIERNSLITSLIISGKINKKGIEVQTFIKPLEQGNELTINFVNPEIINDNRFYTDSNGLDLISRTINQNECYLPNECTNKPTCNYYPITSQIKITDSFTSYYHMSVFPDRPQGGSSLRPSEVELMIHRRLKSDDNKGVFQVLNEDQTDYDPSAQPGPVQFTVKHIVLLQATKNPSYRISAIQNSLDQPLYGFFTEVTKDFAIFKTSLDDNNQSKSTYLPQCQLQKQFQTNLPHGIKFTISIQSPLQFLIRFHNQLDNVQKVNLLGMNGKFLINSLLNIERCQGNLERIVEMNAAGTITLNEMNLMQSSLPWKKNIQQYSQIDYGFKKQIYFFLVLYCLLDSIQLEPHRIRTFLIKFESINCPQNK